MAKSNKGNTAAIVAMIFLFGMIAFVTNLAAPIGNIWKMDGHIAGSNALGMLGNMMVFAAYLFMGLPSGALLKRRGYKFTVLAGIATGFVGVFIQFLSGCIASFPANFVVYLIGAFVSGVAVCLLNTAANPMLTILGGGGNRGNQLIQIAGTCNSTFGTLTPMLVGLLIGTLTPKTVISDVNIVLFLAMAVFAAAFAIISFVKIDSPADNGEKSENPLKYRHFLFGFIAIFMYVGVEVGTPGTLNFFLSDSSAKGAGLDPSIAAKTAGFVAGTYWFLMLVARVLSSLISGKVSSRAQLTATAATAVLFVVAAIFTPASVKGSMPAFTGSGFEMVTVPFSAILLTLCGLCTSVMWGAIFSLATEGLGAATAQASGLFMTMVVGGGILPLIQNFIADKTAYMTSYWVIAFGFAYILWYALAGSRPKNA